MSFNYAKLLGRIKEKSGSQSLFAKSMGISEKSISMKLNNKLAWKQKEILKACEVLEIPNQEINLYFFTL